jgi:4-amino-4-deoxy-L-arabinose transferase-like glycosyltransferase
MPIRRPVGDWCNRYGPLAALLVVSFAGKAALRLALYDRDYWESGYTFYYHMARNYLQTGTLCLGDLNAEGGPFYAFRPPLYPLFIAAVYRLTQGSAAAFIVCEALLSTAAVALVYWITARLARPPAPFLAAIICAFYPYSFYHDTQIQETVLYNVLALAGAACLLVALDGRKGSAFFLAGVLSGAAVLTRASHLTVALFLAGVVLLAGRRQPRQAVGFVLAFALGNLVFLGPWLVRNKVRTGHFALASESGFALAKAHNADTFRYYPYRASIDVSWHDWYDHLTLEQRRALARLRGDEHALDHCADVNEALEGRHLANLRGDEFAQEEWYRRQALAYIRAHPLETVLHGLYKAAVNYLGIFSPLQEPYKNWVYSLSCWTLTLLALCGLPRVRGTSFLKVFAAMVLAQAAVSFVFWAHSSHRSFLDPLFAVLAGIGLAALLPSRKIDPKKT